MSKFEVLLYWLMAVPIFPVLAALSLLGVAIGLFLIMQPALAIEIQKLFYARINWRIEPISMQKEIRNTKNMGYVLLLFSLLTLTAILIKGRIFL